MMMPESIRARMTVTFTGLIAVLMALVCLGLIWYSRHIAEREADHVLNSAIQAMQSEVGEKEGHVSLARLEREELEDFRSENLAMVTLDAVGNIVGEPAGARNALALVRGDGWRTRRFDVGRSVVVMGVPWKRTEAELRYRAMLLLVLGGFVVVLSAAGAWALVGRTLSPIALLSRQANTASVDNLNISLTAPSQDAEIIGLVATLNGLLSRLSETAAAKGRFYSAASHELRTPLQALSGHLELALAKDRSKEEYTAVVEEAHKQADRLISLVRNLLLLYQLDSASPPLPSEPGDLTLVVTRVLAQCRTTIDHRRLVVKTNLPDCAPFTAPPTHMDILVRNLIENAAKYADEGSELSVCLTVDRGMLRLSVLNEYSSVAAWDTDSALEPFARADSSRSNSTRGAGLGLAICKAIAAANGWSVNLTRHGSNVTASVDVPLQQAPATTQD